MPEAVVAGCVMVAVFSGIADLIHLNLVPASRLTITVALKTSIQ
jgi:hypothetical protein